MARALNRLSRVRGYEREIPEVKSPACALMRCTHREGLTPGLYIQELRRLRGKREREREREERKERKCTRVTLN